jgi:Tfp pilus assembly protein PilF
MAEQTLLRAIDIVERTQGPDHPNICALLENLGYLYFKQNDLVRAEHVLRRELAIRRAVFGPENASTASAAATLANVLAARGDFAEAGNLFAEALDTQERVLGRGPEVARTLDQFANLLRQTHRDDLAGDMASRAESIRFESAYTVSVKAQRHR